MNTQSQPLPSLSSGKRIVVVEDEADIAHVVRDYLVHAGHPVQCFADGSQALSALMHELPDLVVLDVMLPGLDGVALLQSLRMQSQVPVIMLTARVEELDRLLALEAGADDYVCKPFSPRELVARVHAVLRRTAGVVAAAPDSAASGAQQLCLYTGAQRLTVSGQSLNLTPKEYRLMVFMGRAMGRVYSRTALLNAVHPDELDVSDRAIDSHVKNLRRKLALIEPSAGAWIRSVYGVGFSLDLPEPWVLVQQP